MGIVPIIGFAGVFAATLAFWFLAALSYGAFRLARHLLRLYRSQK